MYMDFFFSEMARRVFSWGLFFIPLYQSNHLRTEVRVFYYFLLLVLGTCLKCKKE